MDSLGVEQLDQNAFRTLGLTARATQAQIDSAARAMRIWSDPAEIPPTDNDTPWLGSLVRTRVAIENAVARLADPKVRVEERLWWFCQSPAEPASSGGDSSRHDVALVALYRQLKLTPFYRTLNGWKTVLDEAAHLARSPAYRDWLVAAETEGDFEKRACMEEVLSAQTGMVQRISGCLLVQVHGAIENTRFAHAGELIALLRAYDTSQGAAGSVVTRAMDAFEDAARMKCIEFRAEVDSAWATRQAGRLGAVCRETMHRFNGCLLPLIEQIHALSMDDQDDRSQRVRVTGAQLLLHIAEAHVAMNDYRAAQATLTVATKVAANTALESTVRREVDRVEAVLESQRQAAAFPLSGTWQNSPQFSANTGQHTGRSATKRYDDNWDSPSHPRRNPGSALKPLAGLGAFAIFAIFIVIHGLAAFNTVATPYVTPEPFNMPADRMNYNQLFDSGRPESNAGTNGMVSSNLPAVMRQGNPPPVTNRPGVPVFGPFESEPPVHPSWPGPGNTNPVAPPVSPSQGIPR